MFPGVNTKRLQPEIPPDPRRPGHPARHSTVDYLAIRRGSSSDLYPHKAEARAAAADDMVCP